MPPIFHVLSFMRNGERAGIFVVHDIGEGVSRPYGYDDVTLGCSEFWERKLFENGRAISGLATIDSLGEI